MIQIKNITKKYQDEVGNNIALDNISFNLPSKGMVFVVGKSGCGKTTLLNILGGLDSFTSGDIIINGQKMSSLSVKELEDYRNHTVGFVFQDFCLIDRLSVKDNIKLSMEFQNSKEKVDYDGLLNKIGLKGFGKRKPKQLSAGQKQRVAIARAIVKNPSLILADEPTGNVDAKTSSQILDLLKDISKEKLVVVISHNLDEAYNYADRIIEMSDGKVVSDKSLNKNQIDEFYIDESKAILPGNGQINEEQLNILNETINKSNGDFLLLQSEEKFINKEFDEESDNIQLKKVKMSNKAKIKYSTFFLKKKLLFNIFIVLLLTFVSSVFSLVQTLGFSNFNEEFSRMSYEEGYKELQIHKAGDSNSYHSAIDEDVVNLLAEKHNVNQEFAYNITISLRTPEKFHIPYGVYVPSYTSISDGYIAESSGVVCTNMENLEKRFGAVEVLSGEIKEDGIGVVITDYFADCIINYLDEFLSYEDITSGKRINNTVPVDAIIKTDIYERYSKQINNYTKYGKKDNAFLNNLMSTYTYLFTLNENYKQDYKDYFYGCEDSVYIFSRRADLTSESAEYSAVYGAGMFDNSLNGNELKLSYTYYNTLFKTKFSDKNMKDFVPTKVTLKLVDTKSNNYIDQEFLVVDLFSRKSTYDVFRISYDYYQEVMDNNVYSYAVAFFTDYSKENQANIYDFVSELYKQDSKYIHRFSDFNLMYRTLELFAIFKHVFGFLSYILAFAIIMIIILNSNAAIKQNVYEIGLMKALGAKTKDLVVIFALQMIVISLCVCVCLYSFSQLVTYVADIILQKGIMAYIGNSSLTIDFKTVIFNVLFFIINVAVITLGTVLSVIVPIVAIRKIKPLKIIKTRN